MQNDDDTNLRDIELSISWVYLKLHTDKAVLIEIVLFDEQSTFWQCLRKQREVEWVYKGETPSSG